MILFFITAVAAVIFFFWSLCTLQGRLWWARRRKKTIVALKGTTIFDCEPVEAIVLYNAWGTPFAYRDLMFKSGYKELTKDSEGKTWKIVSGPPVRWPKDDNNDRDTSRTSTNTRRST